MKTIGFLPEHFAKLLQGPSVKSTAIRAGDKMKRFKVGEHIEARCRKSQQAVECEVETLRVTCGADLDNIEAWNDGFENYEALWAALVNLNQGLTQEDKLTIIGLRVVSLPWVTYWEQVPTRHLLTIMGTLPNSSLKVEIIQELDMREVQG